MIRCGDIASFLFPSYCEVCGERTQGRSTYVCTECLDALPRYHETESLYHAWDRLAGHVPFTEFRSDFIFTHGGPTRRLLHHLKYHTSPELGYRMARHFAHYHRHQGHFADISMVLPIPLTPLRLRHRSYNQTEYIARGIAEPLGLPVRTDLLIRRSGTGSQTFRSKHARWQAMKGAFAITRPQELQARRILIVDDLLTSGATLVHAAHAVMDAGAESVSFYTLALDIYL